MSIYIKRIDVIVVPDCH